MTVSIDSLKASIASRPDQLSRLEWLLDARPAQLAPDGDWLTWLILAGRGFGKTRAGAEWAKAEGLTNAGWRIAVVAPTFQDCRDTCIEGDSGLLSVLPDECIQAWNRSLGELLLTNGTKYKMFAATEPNRLRGPQHHAAWCDEISSWDYEETWDQLLFGLRLGDDPRICATTTPKPNPLTRRIMADDKTVITRGSTFDNAANLAATALEQLKAKYEGTRLGRQELYAELLDDVPGALWTRKMIEDARRDSPVEMVRIVIGVDPSGSDGETGDAQGIVVTGKGRDGRAYVLQDGSVRASPDEWAAQVERLYDKHGADHIIAERNYGGEMVRAVLQTRRRNLPVKLVTATRGKIVRAEPIAALYEQGKVSHVGAFPDMEDQMTQMTSDGYVGQGSPDRVDALVWALTELMMGGSPTRRVKVKFS